VAAGEGEGLNNEGYGLLFRNSRPIARRQTVQKIVARRSTFSMRRDSVNALDRPQPRKQNGWGLDMDKETTA